PPEKDDFGNTEMILLAKSAGAYGDFRALLKHDKEVNQANYFGITPLHAATAFSNSKVAECLLRRKIINVNAADIRGFTPLHFAAYLRNTMMIALLLEHGADPHARNDYGDTPFLIFTGN